MSIRKICVTAVGIALYVALSLCLQVPVFENYYFCLGYVVMAVYCYSFGPWAGMAVGSLGVVLYCLLISGLRGMPGWAAGNLVIGAAMGLCVWRTRKLEKPALRWAVDAGVIVLATAVGILGVKSLVEFVLYAQPVWFRMTKNSYAFVADVVMLLVSLPLCRRLDGVLHKHFPSLTETR